MSDIFDTSSEHGVRHLLRRRRLLILLTAVGVACAAFAASQAQPPRYEASTDILFEVPVTEPLFTTASDTGDPVRTLQTEVQLVRSEAVENSVRSRLAADATPEVTVEPVGQSNLIRIIAADRIPQHAAAIANAYADSYIEVRKDMAMEARDNAEGALAAEIDNLNRQIDALDERIAKAASAGSAGLSSERDALVSQEAALSTRLREVRVEGAASPGRARVVVPARVPDSPVSPKPFIAAAVGLAFGVLLGVGAALILDYRGARRRNSRDRHEEADIEARAATVAPPTMVLAQAPLNSAAHNGHAAAHPGLKDRGEQS